MQKVYVLTEMQDDGGWIMSNIIGIFSSREKAEERKDELEFEGDGIYDDRDFWLQIDEYNVR